MRDWRKLHSSIVTSERLSRVSDSAKWLFTLLVVAQDDEGKYPWTETRIKALTAGTTWERVATDALATELCVVGIAEMRDGFIVVTNGKEKNGTPHNSKDNPLLYDAIPELDTTRQRVASDAPPTLARARVEKTREDKSREDKRGTRGTPRARKPRAIIPLPDAFGEITTLERFRPGDHTVAVTYIEAECAAAGVPVVDAVAEFVRFYSANPQYATVDPIRMLRNNIRISIDKALHRGTPPPVPRASPNGQQRGPAVRPRQATTEAEVAAMFGITVEEFRKDMEPPPRNGEHGTNP